MDNPIIEFKNFTFQYRAQKNPTLFGINLRIFQGEKILIAGPSGSGKSTLGCCLNGLIPFNSPGKITGELTINGEKPASIFQLSNIVGTVLQDTDGQFVGLSSGEDISFSLENRACPQNEMKRLVLEAAKLVGAQNYLNHSPQRLSGGQKQRVSIAGVLIDRAPILLLDEPFSNLDAKLRANVREEIHSIIKTAGISAILVTHDNEDVAACADRVIAVD